MMLSITGVADSCNPICQGDGWPRPAQAVPAAAITAMQTIANAFKNLNTGILGNTPSSEA